MPTSRLLDNSLRQKIMGCLEVFIWIQITEATRGAAAAAAVNGSSVDPDPNTKGSTSKSAERRLDQ
jgi:hypothetical protein